MKWETDASGNITLCRLMGYGTAVMGDSACALRLTFARDKAALQTGGEHVQLVLTPAQALAFADALRGMAEEAMLPGEGTRQ